MEGGGWHTLARQSVFCCTTRPHTHTHSTHSATVGGREESPESLLSAWYAVFNMRAPIHLLQLITMTLCCSAFTLPEQTCAYVHTRFLQGNFLNRTQILTYVQNIRDFGFVNLVWRKCEVTRHKDCTDLRATQLCTEST